jgi:hypothetical protein
VIIQVGGNTLDCDVEATRAAFRAYTPNLPWTCDCGGCRNYREARESIYAEPVLRFFSQFGIDTTKPAEIYEGGLIGDVFHCAGWFHFVGRIVRLNHEAIDMAPPPKAYRVMTGSAVDISEALRVDFHDLRHLAPESFKNHPLVQLECQFKIPWLLAEPWGSDKPARPSPP